MFNEMDSVEQDGTISFEEWMNTRQRHRAVQRHGTAPSMDLSFENVSCFYDPEVKGGAPKQVKGTNSRTST